MKPLEDEVRVWIAARTLSLRQPMFTLADLLGELKRLFRVDTARFEKAIPQRFVANAANTATPHYNYLFKVGPGKYRAFKAGDPIDVTHASAPTTPNVSDVPEEYRRLFANQDRFPKELRPAGIPAVIEHPKPAGTRPAATSTAPPAPATRGLILEDDGDSQTPTALSRKTILDALFLEFGKLGTRIESPKTDSFVIETQALNGTAHTNQNVMVRMPNGHLVAHRADIVIELEHPARTLYVDIVEASHRADDLKARSFDALHMRKDGKDRYGILVFLRTGHGTLQEQAESMAYAYDYFFGVDTVDARMTAKFNALKAQVVGWAEGRIKPVGHGG